MKMNPFSGTIVLSSLLFVAVSSCQKDVQAETEKQRQQSSVNVLNKTGLSDAASGELSKARLSNLLKDVRSATSRFHSTTQAIKHGYEPDDHCVSVPGLGGMGYHWVNPTLVDGVFDPLQPEVLLYATGPGGNLRLVAVEYIVVDQGQARPMFDSQLFDIGGTPFPLPHWSLHVWLYQENPSGMFRPFNPNISCP